ncbi:uncharacterized protein A4U43_C07F13750 [Asparagus officinalis]|uniref:Bifunctional inhibitor/plant lipid transfer protein/seed storage helical domain-containing protein n=1 Tax=Asparagus officinalis TaxID=4686 RepID=A0A5P1EBQ8_ASPOF|nr:uncharacterized protein LOC109851012 [Asparagus officinalis]ONK63316.1 uncharacterized protein A4U43_C07F13750 [Asparagus officinalis]
MADLNKQSFSIFSLILVMISIGAFARAEQCEDQIEDLVSKCGQYVQWIASRPEDASRDCCAVVKRADVKCVCDHVTEEVEMAIDMDKAVAVAAKCGRPIPPGTQCGAYRVPHE